MTDSTIVDTTEDHLEEARWALAKADTFDDPHMPAVTILVQRSTAHSLVSIAESLRLGKLLNLVDGEVWPMLDEHEQTAIMTEVRGLLGADQGGAES